MPEHFSHLAARTLAAALAALTLGACEAEQTAGTERSSRPAARGCPSVSIGGDLVAPDSLISDNASAASSEGASGTESGEGGQETGGGGSEAGGSLSYRVQAALAEVPVSGAEVALLDGKGSRLTATRTGADGTFVLEVSSCLTVFRLQAAFRAGERPFEEAGIVKAGATAAENRVNTATTVITSRLVAEHGAGVVERIDFGKLQALETRVGDLLTPAATSALAGADQAAAVYDELAAANSDLTLGAVLTAGAPVQGGDSGGTGGGAGETGGTVGN